MSNVHIVKKGDTLWGISNKYNISLNELVEINGLYGKKKNIVFNNVKNKLSANFSDDIDVSKIDFVSPELLGVSPKYIKAFITEKGVIPSSAMYEVSIEYLKEIGGNKI